MATYVNDLRLKEIATGDSAGTWGTETNVNLELIAEAMGHGTEAIANASTHTITMADGVSDGFRCTFLRLTGGGQACTVTLAPNTLSHTWVMRNETSYTLTLTQGSGANVNISSGQTKIVSTNGGGSGAIVYEMDDLQLAGNLVVGGTLGVTGVLTGTSLDISGDIDVDGTTNLDVVDIDGAVNMATTALVTGVLTTTAATVFNGGFASGGVGAFADGSVSAPSITNTGDLNTGMYFDGADSIAFSAGGTARGSFNSGGLQVVGALSATGVVTANAGVVVDNFTLDGTTLALSSGDMTLDVAGDIYLNADGGEIFIADGATDTAVIQQTSSDFILRSLVSDKDIFFRGNDGGSEITALTLDMSAAGFATFNNGIKAGRDISAFGANTGSSANRMALSMEGSGVSRIICNGPDGSTNGTFEVFTAYSGGTGSVKLGIDAAGAATFASSINTNSDVVIAKSATGIPSLTLSGFAGASSPYSIINFYNSDGSQQGPNNAAQIKALAINSDGSGGSLDFHTSTGTGSNGADATKKVTIGGGGAFTTYPSAGQPTVFNENGLDVDFAVESDANSAMLFVDGGENRVGVGTSTPGYTLDVQAGAAATLNIGRSSAYEDFGRLGFSNSRSYIQSEIIDGTANGDTYLAFFTQSGGTVAERLKIELLGGLTTTPVAGGHAVFNEGGIDADFRVESDAFSDALSVDGADGHTTIGSGRFSIGAGGARSQFISEVSAPSGTNVTSIVSIGNANAMSSAAAAACTIYGSDNAGNSFMDVVHYVASQSAVVISSSTVAGSPKSRTYVVAGAVLRVTMGSGASGYQINTSAQVLQYPF